jgi:class 3 adenylate cyclase
MPDERITRHSMRREVAASVEQTLCEEARQNELKLCYVRIVGLFFTSVLDLAAHVHPEMMGLPDFSSTNALHTALWCVGFLGLTLLLRRGWYHPRMRVVLPLVDGLMFALLFLQLTRTLSAQALRESGAASNMAAICTVLAVSGGMRLSLSSAALTTAVAMLLFGLVAWISEVSAGQTSFITAVLLCGGLLGAWMTDLVRRTMESEVGRSVLSRFLPMRVVDAAHKSPLALISEPRTVDATVVVSDLRGFTTMAETLSPTEVLSFLSRIHGRLADIVAKHGGTVDKFLGDGMLAVFGAPDPLPDHSVRALEAVRDMVRAIEEIAAEEGKDVRLGVGVHSGQVVAGCLGSGARLEFTVLGDTVNTASRLESMTKDKGVPVLVSEAAVSRARAVLGDADLPVAVEPMGEVAIRGRKEPLRVHALRVNSPA